MTLPASWRERLDRGAARGIRQRPGRRRLARRGPARTNRQKADQDPATWMPPSPDAHCRYIGEWTATKPRWGLAADRAEADALAVYAEACETTVVHYTPAP